MCIIIIIIKHFVCTRANLKYYYVIHYSLNALYNFGSKVKINLLLLSASPFQGHPASFRLHWVLSSTSSSVTSATAMSSFTTSLNLLLCLPGFLFPVNSILIPISHHLSSVHVQTTSVLLLVFSLQTVPLVLSLWCTHSWSCPFLLLQGKNKSFDKIYWSEPFITTGDGMDHS